MTGVGAYYRCNVLASGECSLKDIWPSGRDSSDCKRVRGGNSFITFILESSCTYKRQCGDNIAPALRPVMSFGENHLGESRPRIPSRSAAARFSKLHANTVLRSPSLRRGFQFVHRSFARSSCTLRSVSLTSASKALAGTRSAPFPSIMTCSRPSEVATRT